MEKNGSLKVIRAAIDQGRPATTDLVPGSVLHHFLYKSRANVQFTMSSYAPEFTSISRRRRLMSIYNNLHGSIHAKNTSVKVHHCVSRSASSFAWVTPVFELYCVAEPNANRNALVQSATKIAQWVHQEEERLFIIGGAVCIIPIPAHSPTQKLIMTAGFLKSSKFYVIGRQFVHTCQTLYPNSDLRILSLLC
jgi:hypothetical protein